MYVYVQVPHRYSSTCPKHDFVLSTILRGLRQYIERGQTFQNTVDINRAWVPIPKVVKLTS